MKKNKVETREIKIILTPKKMTFMPYSRKLVYEFDEKICLDGRMRHKLIIVNAQARRKIEELNLPRNALIGQVALFMKAVGFTRAYLHIEDNELAIRFKIYENYWFAEENRD